MGKKIAIFVILVAIIVTGIIFLVKKGNSQKSDQSAQGNSSTTQASNEAPVARVNNDQLIMYVGNGCPHCKKEEDYITANKLDQKLNITIKEVWYNKDNAAEMQAKAKVCGLSDDQLGVPTIFDASASKCYVGEDEVQKILNQKAGI